MTENKLRKFAGDREIERAVLAERKRGDAKREKAVAEEREKNDALRRDNKLWKEKSRKANADHALALGAAKRSEKIAIEREAAAKVALEATRAANAELQAKLKVVLQLNPSTVDTLAQIIAETGRPEQACLLCNVKFSAFKQWMVIGEREDADPIYRYLVQEVKLARGLAMQKHGKLLEDLSKDVFEDIVVEGEVVGQRMARKASDRVATFNAERLFPEVWGPRAAAALPDEKPEEVNYDHLSIEEMERLKAARDELKALEEAANSKKLVALQRAGRGIVDTTGEDVVDSSPKE